MADSKYVFIAFSTTRGGWRYVSAVRWCDGGGWRVKSVQHTGDRTRAARLSTAAAEGVAAQFPNRVVRLEREDGTVHEEATRTVAAAHAVAREKAAAAAEQMRRDLAPLRDLVAGYLAKL